MPVKHCSLRIDSNKQEIDRRGTPMFPCGGYKTVIENGLNEEIPWHWHEEVEVLMVTSGTLQVEIPGQRFHVKKGDGMFINSGILQSGVNMDSTRCVIKSLVFHPSIISGSPESVLEQRYVRPVLTCGALSGLHFERDQGWHKEAVDYIEDAFEHYRREDYGYEVIVREKLSRLWLLIALKHQDTICVEKISQKQDTIRIKQMLTFIHDHYMEKVELKQIAGAASVSERECLRCFKKTIGTTPVKYLLGHRISVAAGLLTETDLSMSEICERTGFDSPSYFSLMFKKHVGSTPSEYRIRSYKK